MTMKKLIFLIFAASLLFTSCKENFHISASSHVTSIEGRTLYLKVFKDGEMVAVDSARIVHGRFDFSGPMDSVTMACLFMGDIPLMPVVLEKGEISLKLTEELQYPSGTPNNDSLALFIREKAQLEDELEKLSSMESQLVMDGMEYDSIVAKLTVEAQAISAKSDQLITKFISRNYDNVLGAGIFMMLTNNFPYPILNPQIETLLGMGTPYFLENPYVKEYVRIAKENMEKMREEEQQ